MGFSRPYSRGNGFTLIELLVVVAIMTVLMALLVPAVGAARESARRVTCANHQKQIALAMLEYEGSHRRYPAGRLGCDDTGDTMPIPHCPAGLTSEQKTAASGLVLILPQLEQQPLFDQLAVHEGGLWNRNVDDLSWYYSPGKYRAIKETIPLLRCPSDRSELKSQVYDPVVAATTSYALVQGSLGAGDPAHLVKYDNNGMFLYVGQRAVRQITDGLNSTLMLGEVALADTWESSNTWSYAIVHADVLRTTANPLNTTPGAGKTVDRQNGAFGSEHQGGAMFAYADGHVDFLTDDIELATYRALSTIDQGEVID